MGNMKIGLDYGGVISFSPDGWRKTLLKAKENGHEIYIISHAQEGADLQLRKDFASSINAIDLSFAHLKSGNQESEIAQYKADLCKRYNIEIFIDDDLHRVEAVGRLCDRCAALYIPQNLWQIGQRLIDGFGDDNEW
jgi:hypothetical protein